jgi:hypothetical protein
MQLNNADVVKKFIFRYLSAPLTDGFWNILVDITNKDKFNKFIELNKFLNNVCIIRVDLQVGHSIFAHSRSFRPPRKILSSTEFKSAKTPCPTCKSIVTEILFSGFCYRCYIHDPPVEKFEDLFNRRICHYLFLKVFFADSLFFHSFYIYLDFISEFF